MLSHQRIQMRFLIVVLVFCSALFARIDIIELSEDMPFGEDISWLRMANGALYIDHTSVYLSSKNNIYIQKRLTPGKVEVWSTQIKNYRDYTIMRVLPVEDKIYFNLILGNGRFYLAGIKKGSGQVLNLVERHGFPGRMIGFDNFIYVGGLYWSQYGKFLDKYDNSRGEKVSEDDIQKFDSLFDLQPGFTLCAYDDSLKLIDPVNKISRSSVNAKSFMSLYLPQPYDIDKSGEIVLADNVEGYFIKRYDEKHHYIDQFEVINDHYKELPGVLSKESAITLKSTKGSYSAIYAVYEKEKFVISSFYQSGAPQNLPEPPYYYDISTKGGEHVTSGSLGFPLVGEDEKDKMFFYISVEGGWFENDRIFLVGMSVEDILDGQASTEFINEAVTGFMNRRTDPNDHK